MRCIAWVLHNLNNNNNNCENLPQCKYCLCHNFHLNITFRNAISEFIIKCFLWDNLNCFTTIRTTHGHHNRMIIQLKHIDLKFTLLSSNHNCVTDRHVFPSNKYIQSIYWFFNGLFARRMLEIRVHNIFLFFHF